MRKLKIWIPFVVLAFLGCSDEQDDIQNVSISGSIVEYGFVDGEKIEFQPDDIEVALYRNDELIQTVYTANFSFRDLTPSYDYSVVPYLTCETIEDVDSADIEYLRTFIHREVDMSIDELVASDINRDFSVSRNDYLKLVECQSSPMVMYCLDYRFYLEGTQHLTQTDNINEVTFRNLNADKINLKIYAVKSGDLVP